MPRPDPDAYRRFDAQARAASQTALGNRSDIRGISVIVLETIAALPQADVIPEHRRIEWMERTASAELQRHSETTGKRLDLADLLPVMLWHVRRLSGIGGSDAGTILLGSQGLPGSFTTARNIAAQKLLIAAPEPGNDFTQRGTRAEPWLRRILLEQTGARSSVDSLKTLRDFRDDSALWRIGTPDDFIDTAGPLAGFAPAVRRIMIDYKCPSEAEFRKVAINGLGLEYAAQLTHYEAIANDAGVNLHAVALAAFDSRSFRVELIPYDGDPDLAEDLREACSSFWDDYILEGKLPPRLPEDQPLEPTPETKTTVKRMAALKTVIDALGTAHQAMADGLEELYAGTTGSLATDVASYSRKRSWDADMLRDLAKTAGLDVRDHTVMSGGVDRARSTVLLEGIADALQQDDKEALNGLLKDLRKNGVPEISSLNTASLAAAFREADIETTPAESESARFALSRRKAHAEAVGELRREAERIREDVCEYLDEIAGIADAPADEHENYFTPA